MAKLKGVILSVEDVIMNRGDIDGDVFAEVVKLMNYLKLRGIQPILLANRPRQIRFKNTGHQKDLYQYIEEMFPGLKVFSRIRDPRVPPKPQKAATAYVLNEMGWENNEAVYIGSTDDDMRTALNGGLLLLRATWYSNKTNYGFEFSAPKEIARFIDTLCLREHFWSHVIKDGDFEYYALAPFSTMKEEFRKYSEDARAAAKFGAGHPDFWLSALVTSMYFTGIHKRIDFVAPYPGHQAGVDNEKMKDDLLTFGKCFNKGYLHNYIERHTTALKSQHARIAGVALNHLNQLNTIRLNRLPTKNYNHVYKQPPVGKGKTVLLVDDICTRGYSLETARKLIESKGAKTIMVTWLKTINTDIEALGDIGKFDAYQPNNFVAAPVQKTYGYHAYHVDKAASPELSQQLQDYINWDWPA